LEARSSGANLTLDKRWIDLESFLGDVRSQEETQIETGKSELRPVQTTYQRSIRRSVSGLLADIGMYNGSTISGNEKRIAHLEKTTKWFQAGWKGLSNKMVSKTGAASCPYFLTYEREQPVDPGSCRIFQPRVLKKDLFPPKERFFPSSLSHEDDTLLKEFQSKYPLPVKGPVFGKGKTGAAFWSRGGRK